MEPSYSHNWDEIDDAIDASAIPDDEWTPGDGPAPYPYMVIASARGVPIVLVPRITCPHPGCSSIAFTYQGCDPKDGDGSWTQKCKCSKCQKTFRIRQND